MQFFVWHNHHCQRGNGVNEGENLWLNKEIKGLIRTPNELKFELIYPLVLFLFSFKQNKCFDRAKFLISFV